MTSKEARTLLMALLKAEQAKQKIAKETKHENKKSPKRKQKQGGNKDGK